MVGQRVGLRVVVGSRSSVVTGWALRGPGSDHVVEGSAGVYLGADTPRRSEVAAWLVADLAAQGVRGTLAGGGAGVK